MLRWGLLGAARITGKALVPAVRAAGDALTVVGARSLDRARAFAEQHQVTRAVGSYDDVLADPEVDAVYVALPNDLHEPWSVAALGAGKHVLCEKPLAVDAAGAARMAAAAQASGRLLMEAVMTRFHPRTQALVELVRGGGIGPLRAISTGFGFPLDRPQDYRLEAARGGGALLDVGLYGVSMSRWLAGAEPATVAAVARRWPSGVDSSTTALLGFPDGAAATVTASFESARVQYLEVVGARAALQVPVPFAPAADMDAPILRDGEPIGSWRADPYTAMVRAFGAAVTGGAAQAPLPPGESVATAEVLDRVAAAGRPQP